MIPLLEHLRCDCHTCTWLRASQLERACVPSEHQPTMEATEIKKCCLHGETCPKSEMAKPDPVEKKIKQIAKAYFHIDAGDSIFIERLRELVQLARMGKA